MQLFFNMALPSDALFSNASALNSSLVQSTGIQWEQIHNLRFFCKYVGLSHCNVRCCITLILFALSSYEEFTTSDQLIPTRQVKVWQF